MSTLEPELETTTLEIEGEAVDITTFPTTDSAGEAEDTTTEGSAGEIQNDGLGGDYDTPTEAAEETTTVTSLVTGALESVTSTISSIFGSPDVTETVGDAGVDLERLTGDATLLLGAQGTEGTHVVEAVGQLDDDDADVLGHRQHHLLEVLGLGDGLVLEGDLGQLRDAIHQQGDGFAELACQCLEGHAGVFDDIVQHGGHQALMVHVHIGENVRHRQRVGDVRLAGAPPLAVVCLLSVVKGAFDLLDLVRG